MKPKVSYFIESGWPVTGIIHVGASDGEEVSGYLELGIDKIICFEPLRSAYTAFNKNHGNILCLPFGLSNKTGMRTLNVAGGDGKGSSTLKPILDHPEVKEKWNQGQAEIIGKQKAKFIRFDEWADAPAGIKWADYNCLVLDAQGMSYEVIEGFGKYMQNFNYLVIELSETAVYKDEKPAAEVINQLEGLGFIQLTPVHPHDDVLFKRVFDATA